MKYEIVQAKNELGDDIIGKLEIVNINTGYSTGNLYDTPEQSYRELAYLLVAEDLPLPKTTTPEETRLDFLKKIIEAFNSLDSEELLNVMKGNRGNLNFHGRGKSEFKILEDCQD